MRITRFHVMERSDEKVFLSVKDIISFLFFVVVKSVTLNKEREGIGRERGRQYMVEVERWKEERIRPQSNKR